MSSLIPITLTEDTLGKRHKQLNTLVDEAFKSGISFQEIENIPEKTPIDRLFKIDLASKLKNVDYILQNIKNEDLLYVSRALKCMWLVEPKYQDIINPLYLENELFPYMITTAIGKVKNWLYINLKDPQRCEDFYQYYATRHFSFALKFLSSCSETFMVSESVKILDKLSPHQLKILMEKCPKVAAIYFGNIATNEILKRSFLDREHQYFNSFKVLLKQDPDIFFGISEKYFERKHSKTLTKYIITHHKHRFNKKPELYTSRLLNIETLAECLDPEECKEIILKLARAKYLSYWFSYKNVEPLVKRLPFEERSEFKTRVFVDKEIGEEVNEWPYEVPTLPTAKYSEYHVFDDNEHFPHEYENLGYPRRKIMKRMMKSDNCRADFITCEKVKTHLDELFDEFRFMSFGKTLFELRKRIKVESSSQNREYILLVLVSKSGGRTENLVSLLELLDQHINEPIEVKATIARSLVKRAAVWRLPQEPWEVFLKFSRGLGLDGSTPECECREGLHAVVLRNLLDGCTCEPNIKDAFLKQFSRFDEYKTSVKEREIIKIRLPELILDAAQSEKHTVEQASLLQLLFDVLKIYHAPIETSALIPAVKELGKRDLPAIENLLKCLYSANIARRVLFHENFALIKTDASYLNALRHDISVIDINIFLDLIEDKPFYSNIFLRKIAVYFSENGSLTEICLTEIKKRVLMKPNVKLAKPLCLLSGYDLTYINQFNLKEKETARFAAELRSNMHLCRPKLNINELDAKIIGAKAVANRVLVCSNLEVENYVAITLQWKCTVRLGLLLSQKIGKEAETFKVVVSIRPTISLKTAIKYFREKGDSFDTQVWDIIKPELLKFDASKEKHTYLINFICQVNNIPARIRLEYFMILYNILLNNFYYKALSILCHIELLFPNVCEAFIENVLPEFLNEITSDKYETKNIKCTLLYVRILLKYLLIAKNEDLHKERFALFGEKLLSNLELIKDKDNYRFESIFDEILTILQNNKIFFGCNNNSPLLVMEKIVSWMHKHFPIEFNFTKYVYIHLIMLYFKSIRQSMLKLPDVFSNEESKLTDGLDIIGNIFGKYIASEVKVLKEKYFPSIIEIYRNSLSMYFAKYYYNVPSKSRFLVAIIKGMMQYNMNDFKIGIYLLKDEWYNIQDDLSNKLLNEMKNVNDLETKILVYGEFCSEV